MFFLIPVPFLAVGCACFILCAGIPPARRFALASSLWFAAWGIILTVATVAITFIFLGADAVRAHISHGMGTSIEGLSSKWEVTIVIALLLATAAASAPVAIFHGVIMRRITFQLFRLYLCAVAFGVGILVAPVMALNLVAHMHFGTAASIAMTIFMTLLWAACLSWLCYSNAKDFRGRRPETLNPIAPEEYAPTTF